MNLNELQPVGDRILIKPDETESISKGGIIFHEKARDKATTGIVISVGPGRKSTKSEEFIPLEVAIGDRVMFDQDSGLKIKIQNESLIVVTSDELLAKQNEV